MALVDWKAAKRGAIVGAGTSGLAACKHLLARGFRPVVFEAGVSVGGQWTCALPSTRLQSPYRFSDFPWSDGVDAFPRPRHDQVVDYLVAYARRFGADECVRFRSQVVGAEYVGADEAANDSEQWAGNGEAFGGEGAGMWRLNVRHGDSDAIKIYEFDFLVLCIGKFSGVPNIPEFPPNGGPDAFRGRVLHSMDFSDMDNEDAAALIMGKRIGVVGSGKSAFDIAAECAEANGVEHPCTMICRNPQWMLHDFNVWGKVSIGYLYKNRFAERKARRRHGVDPSRHLADTVGVADFQAHGSILQEGTTDARVRDGAGFWVRECASTCKIGMLPKGFYDKVKDGSIVIRRSRSFSFCEDGLVLDGADGRVDPADLVILATGFRGDRKLRDMFVSPDVKKIVAGS